MPHDANKTPEPGEPPFTSGDRALQERMMQVSRFATIGEMAAGVAHELNQPLTAISNYARACERILGHEAGGREDVLEALREIGREADRAAGIIRRLRELARGQPTERGITDLNDVVTEIRDLILGNSRIHDVVVRFELARPLAPVVVDRVQLQHVLLNLVCNALEALKGASVARREVEIRTVAVGAGEVELSVADSGPGVAAQVAGRLFTPFVSTKPSGTGLGLASCQTIVRAHDGTLGHRPAATGGACFYLRLPTRME